MKTKQRLTIARVHDHSRFSWLMVAGLLSPAYPLSALAAGIAAVSGSGTGVATQNGVPVVTIATPSANGLSHNRYTDFNVGREGAVLNNALTNGSSQLAGQLAANANLHGQSAQVILNEVVTANPSQLLGQQEVFGQRAELVLANPNGITCNGCGFINVSHATLAVGSPQVEGGSLKALRVTKPDALLQVDGTLAAGGTDVLTLIAPSARLGGTLQGGQQVAVLLGQNTVDYGSGRITASEAMTNTDRRYDSTLFGAMRAGRIQIVSTAAGVGVNLDAAQLNATDIELTADQLAIGGKVSEATVKNDHYRGNWWNWSRFGQEYVERDETDVRQTMSRSQLNTSGTLKVTANDALTLNAADLNGQDVSLSGKTVTLGTQATTDRYRYHYRDAINLWSYQKDESRDTTTQHGARVNASGQLNLNATQSAALTGAQLSSQGNARLTAGTDLTVNAASHRDVRSLTENEANRTIINNTASSSNYDNQSLLASRIDAGRNAALGAGHDLSLNAAQLKSGGDSLLSASGSLRVDAQSFKTSQAASTAFSNTGGLFGGYDSASGDNRTLYQGSDVQAGGTAYLAADGDVRVRGSRIKAGNGVYAASQHGGIGIDVAAGVELSQTSGSTQTVFGITTQASNTQTTQEVIKGSDLQSDASIQLISATDTAIIGSLLQAATNIGITAAGGLTITSATSNTSSTSSSTVTQGYAEGGATSEAQYRGGVGIETITSSSQVQSSDVVGSTLQSGGDTSLAAGQTVAVVGSTVLSGGDLTMTGTDISVTAAQDTVSEQTSTSSTSGGLYGAAGVDTVGVGVEITVTNTTTQSETSTAVVSSLSAGGDISREASASITDQGTAISAGGSVSSQATDIASLAATSTTASTTQSDTTTVDLGLVGDTGFGRPVYEAIKQTVVDAQDGKVTLPIPSGAAAPTGGAVLTVTSGDSSTTSSTSTAVASTVQAGDDINTQASGTLTLQGTQLSSGGDVTLSAGTLTASVAENQQQSLTESTEGSGTLSAMFTTSGTLNLGASVAITESTSSGTQVSQQGATISGDNVQIAVAGNATLTATQVQSQDATQLVVGGDLLLAAGTDTQTSASSSQGGGGQVGVSMLIAPAPTVTGASVSGNYQQNSASQTSLQAVTGGINAGGDLQVSSGGDLIVTGTVSAGGDASLNAGGDLVLADSRDISHVSSNDVSVSAGVSLGFSGGSSVPQSGSGDLSVQLSRDDLRTETAHDTTVTAGGNLTLSSGGELTVVNVTDSEQLAHTAVSIDAHIAVPEAKPFEPVESPILDALGDDVKTVVNTGKLVYDTVSPYLGTGVTVKVEDSQPDGSAVPGV